MTATEYRQALDTLPFGKRLPGAVYLIDPGEDPRISSLLRITVAELRKRMEIGMEFNLLKFHTASPKISFLAYPDFEKDPHPALKEAVIVDLVTGKTAAMTTAPEPIRRSSTARKHSYRRSTRCMESSRSSRAKRRRLACWKTLRELVST